MNLFVQTIMIIYSSRLIGGELQPISLGIGLQFGLQALILKGVNS